MKFCEKCGHELNGEKFCPSCGTAVPAEAAPAVEAAPVAAAVVAPAAPVAAPAAKFPPKMIAIAVAAVAVVVILIVLFTGGGTNFQKIYDEHCNAIWATVGEDGSYLSIDTNPFDEDDNGLAYYAAYEAVEAVNEELGLPSSLFEEMGETTGSDGRQTREFDGIEVSWKYHPDNGLEVMYKKK